MSAAKKAKIKIREIKPKIKIIGSAANEQSAEKEQESEETQLEGIVTDAPSAREFSALRSGQSSEGVQEIQAPSATTAAEASAGAKYSVQKDISEAEIRKVYQSRIVSPREPGAERQIFVPGLQETRDRLKNREIEALRSEQAEDKYAIDIEVKPSSARRKMPWEP